MKTCHYTFLVLYFLVTLYFVNNFVMDMFVSIFTVIPYLQILTLVITILLFQVQVRHQFTSVWPSASANCAVGVRENDDLLIIDWCDPRYPVRFIRRMKGVGGVIKRDLTGTSFSVSSAKYFEKKCSTVRQYFL